ncbi:MAG TPA: translation elongation factor Ts [Alphaproteobacteria bacterium]|jgi:elongation factor Ts
MAEISASLVKELRERTGAGMMDCKKALAEAGADLEQAADWLRKKGLAAAAKKAGRIAAEGLIGVATEGGAAGARGVVIEVNTETDFVARNEQFQNFVARAAKEALAVGGDVEKLKARPFPGSSRTVGDELTHLVATIGENMSIRRAQMVSAAPGVVASYVHNQVSPGLGKIGVLVALKSGGDAGKAGALGRQLAMHVAAANPRAVRTAELDPKLVDNERKILTEQAAGSGKPAEIIAKMVEGRLRKFYEEVVLLEQVYVIDPEKKVGKVVEAAAKEIGAPVEVAAIARFQLGEGIEKRQDDFAAEVAAAAGTGKA